MTARMVTAILWCLTTACASRRLMPPEGSGVDAASVLHWALGVKHRAPEPRRSDVYVLRRSIAASPRAAPLADVAPRADFQEDPASPKPRCFAATAFLPVSDGRIYYLAVGRVLVADAVGSPPKLLTGQVPGMFATHLLAFAREGGPTRLLLAGRRAAGSRELQIWVLTVHNDTIIDARIAAAEPGLRSQQEFFDAYMTPRCLQREADCLLLSVDHAQAYLDKEPTRDADPVELAKLGEVDVRDAVWADQTSVLLLMGCPSGSS